MRPGERLNPDLPAVVHVLGVRHHGPGSARALRRALEALRPDIVLVELPGDVQPLLPWVAGDDLVPPVAMLGYVPTAPSHAMFVPLASFSPEWIAVRHAAEAGVEVRAIDLPMRQMLAPTVPTTVAGDVDRVRDPIGALAAAAGEPDPERWWDDVIEHRHDVRNAGERMVDAAEGHDGEVAAALAPFEAIAAAMSALRGPEAHDAFEARREASMRQGIRAAVGAGHHTVAVVCGAWHVPALVAPLPPSAPDARLLRAAPAPKVDIAWVPWSHQRLAAGTGYGAGVASPAWYAHVFAAPPDERIERWFVAAAHVLRGAGHDASPDHLIAAARLADALCALRGRPSPGLDEMLDALTAVLGEGGAAAMALVHSRLVVGESIGEVPLDAPMVPLARDLTALQRRLRLRPATAVTRLELDLRTPLGRRRSHLLHRMRALAIPWGQLDDWRGSSGTFREMWVLQWRPELAVPLVERASFGTTVEAAAQAYLVHRAADASMAEVVHQLDIALSADLPGAVSELVATLGRWASAAADIGDVIDTLTPLAKAVRYGDVRGSDLTALREVFDALIVHVLASLRLACRALDHDAAIAMAARLGGAQAALALVEHPARVEEWPRELLAVAAQPAVPALVRGRAVRLARDAGFLDPADAGRWLSRALSPAVPAADAAGFVEGFLASSGALLGHDPELLGLIDGWMSTMSTADFDTTVPLLRRTFADFEPAERRRIAAAVNGRGQQELLPFGVDPDRARLAIATVRAMLGAAAP